jgi:hypothetical protein
MMLVRALSRRQEKGKAHGIITAKALAVLQALLWGFRTLLPELRGRPRTAETPK